MHSASGGARRIGVDDDDENRCGREAAEHDGLRHHGASRTPAAGVLRRDQGPLRRGARPAPRRTARRAREQYTSDLDGELADYAASIRTPTGWSRARADHRPVEVLFIGGGFSALLTSARLRERGVESIRIVERGADVGGTWYWNRYPGVACDVVAYDYLPLLDEMNYVPTRHYAAGPGDLRPLPGDRPALRPLRPRRVPDHGDVDGVGRGRPPLARRHRPRRPHDGARFVICANGTLAKPRLADHRRHGDVRGHSFHTSRWDYEFTGARPRARSRDKVVGIIGTGASAVQIVPNLGADGQGAVRLPAHAVVDRRPRRLGDRRRSGRPSCRRAGRRSGGRRSSSKLRATADAGARTCAGSPARRRSAARRTPTSTR